ncbi:3-keto-disaccharide hydrolase [Ulvibacterium sp.]|uniref:3-keto-disaccharide hydrolase n=1 Tax=Ulvibacterium sp. TaxID=2665914 RepID=UPI003BAC9C3C
MNRIFGLICVVSMMAVSFKQGKKHNETSPVTQEMTMGNDDWISLMDASLWRGYNEDSLPGNWQFKDDIIECYGTGGDIGGDIITKDTYDNFELSLEWKITAGGNSGIFYHVVEDTVYKAPYETGAEYQLLDDDGFSEPIKEWQKSGANYAMHVADKDKKQLKPVGEWNSSKIVFNKGEVEHWLNGEKIVTFNKFSEDWKEKRNSGKWNDFPDYGKANDGYLGLQDHGAGVWFRNVKVKRL